MFLRFGTINIWPIREKVDKAMLEDFKTKYPKTRVILDCTEIKCQMPRSLLLNSRLFSSNTKTIPRSKASLELPLRGQ